MTDAFVSTLAPGRSKRIFYGWIVVGIAALAMVGTLPGRTQGLGLITEPLMRDLGVGRVAYAQINLVATLVGSLFCIGVGRLIDRRGSRAVLTALAVALGLVVIGMSRAASLTMLFVMITLTRGLGQSALSVVSLAMVGKWFRRRLTRAMAVYSLLMSIGFMAAFPLAGAVVLAYGWRTAWAGIGVALVAGLAPLAWLLVRSLPEDANETVDGLYDRPEHAAEDASGATLREALATPAFWVFAIASALYGLVASGIGLFNESILAERGFAPGVYHQALAVMALTALAGNFLSGAMAGKGSLRVLLLIALVMLSGALAALPLVTTVAHVMAQAVAMGIAGGFVMVVFFSFWGRAYGRAELGRIQGAAQAMTVVASATGPLLVAWCVEATGSYAAGFYGLSVVVALTAVAAAMVRVPQGARAA
ncbi:MAG: MFS transporter [Acidobacteriota bacterium]|nr:MFS transporter [Acidobacteriota bacterium]